MAQLRHPHICAFFGLVTLPVPCLVTGKAGGVRCRCDCCARLWMATAWLTTAWLSAGRLLPPAPPAGRPVRALPRQ